MAGINAFGTLLKMGDGATPTEAFTTIANIHSLTGPSLSRETLDATAHDSPNKTREFTGSLKDPGEVTAEVHYDPAVHDPLRDLLDDDEPTNFQIHWPPSVGGNDGFAALLTGFEATAPFDGLLGATLTFKVTGSVTATPAP
jgi:hypothetical protein